MYFPGCSNCTTNVLIYLFRINVLLCCSAMYDSLSMYQAAVVGIRGFSVIDQVVAERGGWRQRSIGKSEGRMVSIIIGPGVDASPFQR